MSECSKYNLLISAYIDGELSESEANSLKKHLETCPDCRSYLKILETVNKQLKNNLEEPPKELKDSIMNRLKAEPQKKRLRFITIGRYAAVAAVFCVVLLGAYKLIPKMGAKSDTGAYNLASRPEDDSQAENYGYAFDDTGAGVQSTVKGTEAPAEEGTENGDAEKKLTAAAPVPAPTDKSEEGLSGFSADSVSRSYEIYKSLTYEESFYSVCFIYGETPKEIEDCEVLYTGEGQTHYKVPVDLLLELDSEGFAEIYYDKLTAKYALVIVMTEE